MARILVAASPEPSAILERMLAGHALCCAGTIEQAEQCLTRGTFDRIICTLVFDDSRMFDLLRFVKSKVAWQRIPFVCARLRRHVLDSPPVLAGVAASCKALGAAAFLDIADYHVDPQREMRDAIERLLDTAPRTDAG